MKKYKEARLGRRIALDFYKTGRCFREGGRKMLLRYRIGVDASVDNVLKNLYAEVNSLGNPMPKRVRIEEGVLRLEELLLGRP